MRELKIGLLIATAIVLMATVALAEPPPVTNYQGVLTDAESLPLNGNYALVFKIYDSDTEIEPLWTETHSTVAVSDGVFSVILGGITPYPEGLFDGNALWVGVTVGDDEEITPRMQMTSVPWSLRAAVADTALSSSGGTGELELPFYGEVASDGNACEIVNTGSGNGVVGESSGMNSTGIRGRAHSVGGRGVFGSATDTSDEANNYGGYFITNGATGFGVYAEATNEGPLRNRGVAGVARGETGFGVSGSATGPGGVGVWGWAANDGASMNFGGSFHAFGETGRGVHAHSHGWNGIGVFATADGISGVGVNGIANDTGDCTNIGGQFHANGTTGRGVYAIANGESGRGLHARADGADAVAVYAEGKVQATDQISAAGIVESTSGGFKFPDGTVQTTAGGGFSLPYEGEIDDVSSAFSVVSRVSAPQPFTSYYAIRGTGIQTVPSSVASAVYGGYFSSNSSAYPLPDTPFIGVFGSGATSGVSGECTVVDGIGVSGKATNSGGIGVTGQSTDGGTGVEGRSANGGIGVKGYAERLVPSGEEFWAGHFESSGLFGGALYARSADYWACVFDGNMKVQGEIHLFDPDTEELVMYLGSGLDYAEGFDVSNDFTIEPGSVLAIDPENPGDLCISDTPYDTKVAGIVSGGNELGSGVILGGDDFDVSVALAGRVYTNVDASEHGIVPGDLLTTSSTPGYAMKVVDHDRARGAILGKAMENLDKGRKGKILVFVTLQ